MSQLVKHSGKNATIAETLVVHPAHADGLVHSGDPVVCGQIVGIADTTAKASTDDVVVITEGVVQVRAVAADGSGNSAIAIGDSLYIDPATAVVNKNSAKRPYGVAYSALGSGVTGNVDVKLTPANPAAATGGGSGSFATRTITGAIDGVNAVFTLDQAPSPSSSLILAKNGQIQAAGGADFTLAGATVTFAAGSIPQTGDTLQAWSA